MKINLANDEVVSGQVFRKKPCATCGKTFQPKTSHSKYCSEECRRGTGVCTVCGVTFLLTKPTTGLYCSPECWYKAPGKKLREDRQCQVCGKTYFPKREDQKYCSFSCSGMITGRIIWNFGKSRTLAGCVV